MTPTRILARFPRFVRRWALHFECGIEDAVEAFAQSLPRGAHLLDAGAGEGRYKPWFPRLHYVGLDLAVGDTSWNYGRLDVIADLNELPFADATFDAALNIVTIEHLQEPLRALTEIARTLRPGAPFLLVAPLEWEVHQAPHDYFRYTRHGMQLILEKAGFDRIVIHPSGGYFRLMSRRMLNGLQFFGGGYRWLLFLPAAAILIPLSLVLPLFEGLDQHRNFTLGYLCTAQKS